MRFTHNRMSYRLNTLGQWRVNRKVPISGEELLCALPCCLDDGDNVSLAKKDRIVLFSAGF
jgi:hypothetical protein